MIDAGKDIVGRIQDLYNSSQPVNQLPPEILAHIFKAVQIRRNLTSFPPRPFGRDTKRANEWLKVTHVCRYWRRVALSTPSLWTNIVLSQHVTDFEDLNRWFLENCGPSLLLSLDMHFQMVVERRNYAPRKISQNFIDAFSSNLHRFESLVIHDFFGRISSHSPHDSFAQSIQQMYPLPVHLKRLSLPFHINVSNRAVEEIKRLTNHVTHFAFLDQKEQRRSITLQGFLDFLRSSPMLESLWIENAGPIVRRGDIRENMDTINMPYLRSVRYKDSSQNRDDASSFYWLVTVIKVPEDAAVYLTSPLIPKALEHSTEMYQALSPFFERLSRVQILQETSDSADLIFHDDRLYMKIPENAYFYQAQDGPYSRVETIIFEDGRFHCTPARLRRLLKPFVNLRRMDVLWEYPYEFDLNPLLETFNNGAKNQPPICPQLQEVGIRLKKKHLKGGGAVPVAMTREDTGGTYMILQEKYRGADRSTVFSGCPLNDTFQLGGV